MAFTVDALKVVKRGVVEVPLALPNGLIRPTDAWSECRGDR